MKDNNHENRKLNNIPDLDIIDLDNEPLERLMDPTDVFPEPEDSLKQEPAPEPEAEPEGETEQPAIQQSETEQEEPPTDNADDTEEEYLSENDNWITYDLPEEDSAPEEEAYDDEEPEGHRSFFQRAKWHLTFAAAVVLIVLLAFNRIWNYGIKDDLSNYEGNYSNEVLDSILPLIPAGDGPIDDGVTTIVTFGNAPFADDRDSDNSLAHMIEDMTGATVYNCSVSNSYLAADAVTLRADLAPMDAFTFYWLTTAFVVRNNEHLYQDIFNTLGENMPPDALEAYETMLSIDFDKVDVIAIMYDGSDYLMGHNMYSDENDTDIQQFTGNMTAGIDLIKQYYPNIRIIVMSPTYAFAVNENGDYISSDQYRYNNQDVLSTYVIKQFQYAYDRGVTFVDNLYGTITEDNASQYLTDNLHLNEEGRRLVAERFVYALNYYNENADTQ